MLFPHLTSTACLGGEGVRQCTLVWALIFWTKANWCTLINFTSCEEQCSWHHLLWNLQNREHQKYLWNVIMLQGISQLGARYMIQLNRKQQQYLICGFEVCLRILNFIVTATTQSTLLKLFRCSCFSEFDIKRKHDQLDSECKLWSFKLCS